MFDDPKERLDWMNSQLLEEEDVGYNYAADLGRTVFDDEEEMVCVEVPRKKGMGGLKFLAFLEILGILAVIGWWLRWLI